MLPKSALRKLLQAANYYGDTQLVLSVIAEHRATAREFEFDLAKEEAKALKNVGDFEGARECFVRMMRATRQTGDETGLAYALLLYAKLCADYQQRQGWYAEFHGIGLKRLQAASARDDAARHGRRLAVWHRIAEDSFARAVYAERPDDGERRFQALLGEHQTVDDALVRIRAHLHESRIADAIGVGPDEVPRHDVDAELLAFSEVVRMSLDLGNVRAWNVRQVQLLELSRRVAEWLDRRPRVGRHPILLLYEGGEADYLARQASKGASALSDRKTAARAWLERALWLERTERRRSGRTHENTLREMLEYLDEARQIFADSPGRVASIYHATMMHRARVFTQMRDWRSAAESLHEAYEYGKGLRDALVVDERALAEAERVVTRGQTATAELSPEFASLDAGELRDLARGLTVDYRVLLERLLEAGEELRSVQVEQIKAATRHRVERSKVFRYHRLASNLRLLEERADATSRMAADIAALRDKLTEWQAEEEVLGELGEIDLVQSIQRVVQEHLAFREYASHIDLSGLSDGRKYVVNFDLHQISIILETFAENARDAAMRAGRGHDFRIWLDLVERDDLVWLVIADELGDTRRFRRVIDRLNDRKPVPSRRGAKGGIGLSAIRAYLDSTKVLADWELRTERISRRASTRGTRKVLYLPLARRLVGR
ncbi:MAG: hypothetical protein JO180_02850 [Gemmatirosa sp.]|nr:hypothetical protein [Gemmatirosa sp.]